MAKPAPAPVHAAPPAAPAPSPYTFAIEKNVPLPVKRVGVKGQSLYPFAALDIGDSFFVQATDKMREPWKTLTSMASRETKTQWPKRFVTAREPAKGEMPEGVRIWRTSDGTGDVPVSKPRAKPEAPVAAANVDPFAQKAA